MNSRLELSDGFGFSIQGFRSDSLGNLVVGQVRGEQGISAATEHNVTDAPSIRFIARHQPVRYRPWASIPRYNVCMKGLFVRTAFRARQIWKRTNKN